MAKCRVCDDELETGKALSFSKAENGICGNCVEDKASEQEEIALRHMFPKQWGD